MTSKKPDHREYASSPCFAHELVFGPDGAETVDAQNTIDVSRWRKAKREELITARLAVSAGERQQVADEVAEELDDLIHIDENTIISLYWPFRGELDLRNWMRRAFDRGARIALPVVEAKAQPLVFREWTPDCKMERGVWNILNPAGTDLVTPTVVISPLVGYDRGCFRLGYGGGFFDRTLAELSPRPMVIGVGHPSSSIPTIYAQPHDIPMDYIVTGAGKVQEREV